MPSRNTTGIITPRKPKAIGVCARNPKATNELDSVIRYSEALLEDSLTVIPRADSRTKCSVRRAL